ncbi:2-phosphosulfolactate phosphatase, partial [Streptomyces sp. NPDC059082]
PRRRPPAPPPPPAPPAPRSGAGPAAGAGRRAGCHPDDVELCLEVDRFPFAMVARREDSLTVLRPVTAPATPAR